MCRRFSAPAQQWRQKYPQRWWPHQHQCSKSTGEQMLWQYLGQVWSTLAILWWKAWRGEAESLPPCSQSWRKELHRVWSLPHLGKIHHQVTQSALGNVQQHLLLPAKSHVHGSPCIMNAVITYSCSYFCIFYFTSFYKLCLFTFHEHANKQP